MAEILLQIWKIFKN